MTDRVHGLSSHQDFGRVVADHGREDGFVGAGSVDAALQRSREALARIPDVIPPRPTLLAELRESLIAQRSVLTGANAYEMGMSTTYTFILQEVDSLIRREVAVAQAKAEFHAKSARRS